CQHAYGIPFTF
nr:immunoglobulin light chain junction region [Macaca mulatta]MOV34204.1 immunoglobulin light chain junction region [Macaca mulatta]MOV34223.1 immunoglobulin light chain junction region [Macaca mulatta]MOV34240.1 immunoglobulin light chain junction region [Macaca mulatta]MOV34360.1 immunoglobulin light chain junction region [Macaca mulatta]